MSSQSIEDLREEIKILDAALIASISTNTTVALDKAEAIRVRAFLVLAHAAIEEFVEDEFFGFVKWCTTQDAAGRVHSRSLITLLDSSEKIGGHFGKKSDRDPSSVASYVAGTYESHVVKPNNGIRKANFRKLARAAGIPDSEFDATCAQLLIACETLGAKRGLFAHSSVSGTIRKGPGLNEVLYPVDARKFVDEVLAEIPTLLELLVESRMAGMTDK